MPNHDSDADLDLKRRAFAEIVAWIADDLIAHSAEGPDPDVRKGHYIAAPYSVREECSDLLWQCGIVEPLKVTRNGLGQMVGETDAFRLCLLRDDWREAADSYFKGEQYLEYAINCFVRLVRDYYSIYCGRDEFFVDEAVSGVFAHLQALGYVAGRDRTYQWTSAIAPYMERNFIWTEVGQSVAALQEASLDRVVRDLPANVRHRIAALAASGQYVPAVAALRDATGLGLAESMKAMDRLYPELRSQSSKSTG